MFRRSSALAAAFAVPSLLVGTPANATTPCDQLKDLKLTHVIVADAKVIESKSLGGVGAGALPSYCRVIATSRPTKDSEIRLEVAIPLAPAWNGRYLQLGNGGFAGAISEPALVPALQAGFAVAATDD